MSDANFRIIDGLYDDTKFRIVLLVSVILKIFPLSGPWEEPPPPQVLVPSAKMSEDGGRTGGPL